MMILIKIKEESWSASCGRYNNNIWILIFNSSHYIIIIVVLRSSIINNNVRIGSTYLL